MTLEPMTVEEGFLKRGSIQALKLILKSPIMWGTALLIAFLGSQLMTNTIWSLMFGMWFSMFCMDLAYLTDNKNVTFKNFIETLIQSSKNYLLYLKNYFAQIVGFFIIMLIIVFIFYYINPNPESSVEQSIFYPLFLTLLFSYITQNSKGAAMSVLSYLIMTRFNVDDKATEVLCEKASQKNRNIVILFMIVLSPVFLIIFFWTPYVSLIVIIFLPTLIYVAFKEIFIGTKEEKKEEKKEEVPNALPTLS